MSRLKRDTRVRLVVVAALGGAAGLAGCKVGPDYQRPAMELPTGFRDSAPLQETEASIADLAWWEVFDDPQLVALIDEALRNNRDLKVAVARIEQAQGVRAQVLSPLFPQIGYGGGVSRGKNESFGGIAPVDGSTSSKALVDVNVAWEIDLWGRIRRADDAALALILQSEEAKRALMLSLVSEVAANWFQLLGFDEQLRIARQNVVAFNESVILFQDRAEGGIASDLPVLRAEALKALAEAEVPEIERRTLLLENAVSVLCGRAPGPIARADRLPLPEPPEVPVGLPSQLLERRPDVLQAEAFMVQTNAEIGVATADFFPRLGLTTVLGRATPELSDFSSGTWNVWSIAANAAGPLFTGGLLTGQLESAKSRWIESIASYEQTVLEALADTSNALIDRDKLREVEVQQQVRVNALAESVELALLRYDLGKASYYEVLEAQQQLFPAEQVLAATQTDQLLAYTRLYRALGGGWNLPDGDWIHADVEARANAAAGAAPPTVTTPAVAP